MLYLSTNSRYDTYTAYRAIHHDTAPDGGLFLPFRLPKFDGEAIRQLSAQPYWQTISQLLYRLLGVRLTAQALCDAMGGQIPCIHAIQHRVAIARLWQKEQPDFEDGLAAVSRLLRVEEPEAPASSWLRVAVRIAAIFGLYGLLVSEKQLEQGEKLDITLSTGDFSAPMAAWFAREMGLPIGTIVIGCNENSGLWDLFNLGDIATGETVLETLTPLCDYNAPVGLGRLIYRVLGPEEAVRFETIRRAGRHYVPQEEAFEQLRAGIFTAVSSISRVDSVIRNVCSTAQYILSPYDALAYGALLDYRSKSGQGSTCLLLSERSPLCDDRTVAYALGIEAQQLADQLQ